MKVFFLGNLRFMYFVCILFTLISCVNREKSKEERNSPKPAEQSFHLVDPDQLEVGLSLGELSESEYRDGYTLPKFTIDLGSADHVQILRCDVSFRNYVASQIEQGKEKGLGDRKLIWLDAMGDQKHCKIVTLYYSDATFYDLTARNGTFFYLVNPCISEDKSSTKTNACSYKLRLSNTLNYSGGFSAQLLSLTAKLADAESAYEAILNKVSYYGQQVINRQKACEYEVAHEKSLKSVRSLGYDLISVGIAAIVTLGARFAIGRMRAKNPGQTPAAITNKQSALLARASKNLNKTSPFMLSAGIGSGTALLLRGLLLKGKPVSDEQISCLKAKEYLDKIQAIMEAGGSLEQKRNELIQASRAINELDEKFRGYTLESLQY